MDILEKCVMFICTVGEVDDTWETQTDPDNSTVYDKLSGWDTMEEQLVVHGEVEGWGLHTKYISLVQGVWW